MSKSTKPKPKPKPKGKKPAVGAVESTLIANSTGQAWERGESVKCTH